MSLPVLNTPKYQLEQPSTGEKITYRPFLVKEQKVIMMAQEANDSNLMMNSIGEIIKTCTFGKISRPETLPIFDIEYMFLMIRSKSVGSTIDLKVTCPDDGETVVDHQIEIDDIKVIRTEGHQKEIMLTDDVGVVMRYPTINMVTGFDVENALLTKPTFELIRNSIQSVFDKENTYDEMDAKELDEFIESMNTAQFEKMSDFFDTMPKLKHTFKVTNPNTEVESEVTLEGLSSFLE